MGQRGHFQILMLLAIFCACVRGDEECPFVGLDDGLTPSESATRLQTIETLFESTEIQHGANPAAMVELFKSLELVPKNGVIHVVGPNLDFYEWLVPLMARTDIKIIVSEPDSIMELTVDEKGTLTPMTWKSLTVYNQELMEKHGFDTTEGRRELQERVHRQVAFIPDVSQTHFSNGKVIPMADLIIARAPRKESWGFESKAKPGTLIWTVTEKQNIPNQARRVQSQLAEMLPPRDFEDKNRFKAMDLAIYPAFWIHKEQ